MTDEEKRDGAEIADENGAVTENVEAHGEATSNTPQKKKKEGKTDLIFYIVCALILACSIGFRIYWTDTYCAVTVSGDSMNQTLKSGDKLLMNYYKGDMTLTRGDIIVVDVSKHEECAHFENPFLIKRLIAMEGDKVKCVDGQVYIWYAGSAEYVALDEPYAYYTDAAGYDFSEYVVGEGEIFFLGDNRNNSCDSRYNQLSGSHIDELYNEEDVYGIVTDWAYENRGLLETWLFVSCAGQN